MKKVKKIIGILLIVLVILGTIFAVLYLKTDLLDFLKKPKTLFYTYLIKNKEGLPETNYYETAKKISEEPWEENGEIYWNFEIKDADEKAKLEMDIVNNIKLNYNAKANIKENNFADTISIKYQDETLATLEAILTDKTIGIKMEDIYDKYIAIENNNIKKFIEKFGVDATTIPNRIEINPSIELDILSQEDVKAIKERYLNVLNESIPEENITRSKEVIEVNGKEINTKTYTLTLSQKETIQIAINLLKELKNDDVLLECIVSNVNKINEQSYGQEYQKIKKSELKQLISYLTIMINEENYTSEEAFSVTVYESKGKTTRTKISSPDVDIILDREQKGKNINMNLRLEADKEEMLSVDIETIKDKNNNQIRIASNMEDLFNLDIKLNYNKDITEESLEILFEQDENKLKFNANNKLEFKQVEIAEPKLEDIELLNNKSDEELKELFTRLEEEFNRFYESITSKFAE